MLKKIFLFLTVIITFQLLMCGKDNPINTDHNSKPPGLTLTIDGSTKDTLICGIDTLLFWVTIKRNEFYSTQYPWGASEPVIIKVVKDSSHTSWALPISFSIIKGFCTRDDPPSSCGFSVALYSEFRNCRRRYFYYVELVNDPTVRSSIYSFFAK
ncbi:MAG: hypothetical protein QME52_06190 [Bacteroidota bacterium]|nr:hypothetical protein [Bacteroidota bacterium]